MASLDVNFEKGLPASLDAERFVLGSILLDDTLFVEVASSLEAEDFSLEKHRRIFLRMGELHSRGERIDRLTVAEELMKHGQLEACDGIGYLVSLDDGLPQIRNVDSYVRIVKDKSLLRRVIYATLRTASSTAASQARRLRRRSSPTPRNSSSSWESPQPRQLCSRPARLLMSSRAG